MTPKGSGENFDDVKRMQNEVEVDWEQVLVKEEPEFLLVNLHQRQWVQDVDGRMYIRNQVDEQNGW